MGKLALFYTILHDAVFDRIKWLDGLPPLLIRLYLAPIMIAAGLHKLHNYDDMVAWFGNADWGLGLPAPALMVSLAIIPAAQRSLENSEEVGRRVAVAKSLLKDNGNYSWLTEKGSFVVLNNGIEFAATYLVMLLSLFFTGGGRFFSLDYWLKRHFWRDVEG